MRVFWNLDLRMLGGGIWFYSGKGSWLWGVLEVIVLKFLVEFVFILFVGGLVFLVERVFFGFSFVFRGVWV